jgi:hypothetical protein
MSDERNKHTGWVQGRFIMMPEYSNWSNGELEAADEHELHLVRRGRLDNAICHCPDPADAKWIAERLNRCAQLEAFLSSMISPRGIVTELQTSIKRYFNDSK